MCLSIRRNRAAEPGKLFYKKCLTFYRVYAIILLPLKGSFFFAKEPVVMPCAPARVLFVRVFSACGCNGTGKTEGGVYFYVAE